MACRLRRNHGGSRTASSQSEYGDGDDGKQKIASFGHLRTSQHVKDGATKAPHTRIIEDGLQLTRGIPSRKRSAGWLSSAPVVGRDAILDALREPLRVSTIILGEPGIGKSRVLAEARREAGENVFYVACVPAATSIPYEPLTALLRTLHSRRRLKTESLNAALKSRERDRLFYLYDALADAASSGPLTVQIDDLHLSDGTTLQALQYCIARLQDMPITWHLAARHGNQAVTELTSSLERSELARVITLDGLSAENLKTLAVHLRPEVAFEDAQVAKLHERTGGNPLYAELLLIAKSPSHDVPADLRQALNQRLSSLNPETIQVAGWLAVHADTLSEMQLSVLAKRSPAQIRSALSELADNWIVSQSEDGFRFRHCILREACYELLGEESRVAKHLALAKRTHNSWRRAAHLEGAQRFSEAAQLCLEIGWECLERHAPQEALNAFLRTIDRTEPDDPLSLEASGGRAAALFRSGEVAEAKLTMSSFEESAETLEPSVRLRVRTHYAEAAWDESDDSDSLLPILNKAIEEARIVSPDFLPALLCVLGSIYERLSELELAGATLREGIALCDEQRHRREKIRLHSWLGVVMARLGDPEKGIAVLESAAHIAADLNLSNELVQCCTKLCYVSHVAGDNERYERWCRAGLNAAGPKSRAAEALLRSNLASIAIDQGHPQEALGLALTAETGVSENNMLLRCRLLCVQAQLYAMLGDLESAERVLKDGIGLELPTPSRRAVAFTAGFVSELREDCERALDWYAAAVSALETDDIREVHEVNALAGIVRVASLLGDAGRAKAALEKLRCVGRNGWPVAQRALLEAEGCYALLQGDLGGCSELLEAACAGQYPFWKAYLHVIVAHASGDRDLFLEAIETFDSLGAEHESNRARALARTHGLRPGRKREPRGTLSARETSVAFLVANGKTNAEIGALLHVSARTVEYHVGNILSKCCLRSRVEIAAKIAAGTPLGAAV